MGHWVPEDTYAQTKWRAGVSIGRAHYVPQHEFDDAPGELGTCAGCGRFKYMHWDLSWNRPPRGYEDWPKSCSAKACSLECAEAKAAMVVAAGECLVEGDLGT